MNFKKIFSFTIVFVSYSMISTANASFSFGLYPENNNTREIVQLEKKYSFRADTVGYIFDTFSKNDADAMNNAINTLGKDRTYHVTLSPLGYTAKEVANGAYDKEYKAFFELAHTSRAHFIFRTMHEMNGSWYSWSGDPENFKLAWKHIWNLSREAGLSKSDILFVFSANSEDLPSIDGKPGSQMVYCSPAHKAKHPCTSFEDFYPGEEYVDLMGMTIYNWGRGKDATWAHWRNFQSILLDPKMNIFKRLITYKKPIFLDEIGTTAVNFSGAWTKEKVQKAFKEDSEQKNTWLGDMGKEISRHPEIIGALYFNRDRTQGFNNWKQPEELDWAAFSPDLGKEYKEILSVFQSSNPLSLTTLFGVNPLLKQSQVLMKKIIEGVEMRSTDANGTLNRTTRNRLMSTMKSKLQYMLDNTKNKTKQTLLSMIIEGLE